MVRPFKGRFKYFSTIIVLYPQSRQRLQGKKVKKRGQRATSNIFAMFDQAQIQEFKEVGVPVES